MMTVLDKPVGELANVLESPPVGSKLILELGRGLFLVEVDSGGTIVGSHALLRRCGLRPSLIAI